MGFDPVSIGAIIGLNQLMKPKSAKNPRRPSPPPELPREKDPLPTVSANAEAERRRRQAAALGVQGYNAPNYAVPIVGTPPTTPLV